MKTQEPDLSVCCFNILYDSVKRQSDDSLYILVSIFYGVFGVFCFKNLIKCEIGIAIDHKTGTKCHIIFKQFKT